MFFRRTDPRNEDTVCRIAARSLLLVVSILLCEAYGRDRIKYWVQLFRPHGETVTNPKLLSLLSSVLNGRTVWNLLVDSRWILRERG